MEDMQLYTCYSPLIKQFYLIIVLVVFCFWVWVIKRLYNLDSFFESIVLSFIVAAFIGFIVSIIVYSSDGFYITDRHTTIVIEVLKFSSNISMCIDGQVDVNSIDFFRGDVQAEYPKYTKRVIILLVILFLCFIRVTYDLVRFICFISDAMGGFFKNIYFYIFFVPKVVARLFKNISLRILLAKQERKLKALRSEEEGKLNAVKVQLEVVLEAEKKAVEKTLLQLAAQQQRVDASRQKLMVRDMD